MTEKFKFIAIKKGHKTGIYNYLEDWESQIVNFKKPVYKGFNTLEEAQIYIAGSKKRVKRLLKSK